MVPAEGRLSARRTAPFHIQFELEKSEGPIREQKGGRVQGRAIRVFRTDGRLAVGGEVAFRLWVCEPGKEPTGEAYIYCDDLRRATYIEAYLYGIPPKLEIAAYEFGVIDEPSEHPSLTVEELENWLATLKNPDPRSIRREEPNAPRPMVSKPKKWQFWKA